MFPTWWRQSQAFNIRNPLLFSLFSHSRAGSFPRALPATSVRGTGSLRDFHQPSTREQWPFPLQPPRDLQTIPSTLFTSANRNLIKWKSVLRSLEGEPISPGACRSPRRVWAAAAGLRLPSVPQSHCSVYGDTRSAERLPVQPALPRRYGPLTNKQVFPPRAAQNGRRSHQSLWNWNEFKHGVTSTF